MENTTSTMENTTSTMENTTSPPEKERGTLMFAPLIITGAIILLDQISKLLVLKYIPSLYDYSDSTLEQQDKIINVIGDFLWFINVSNKGALFSFGTNFTQGMRSLVLFILPIILIVFMLKIVIYSNWDKPLRWIAAGIVGGGVGNMIDRILREDGVVDFISVKIYGLFGMDRWPTFNIADSSIVVCMILWIFFTLKMSSKHKS